MFSASLSGFLTSLSLILAIGAQNAFILRQGLKREHIFSLCLFCALLDALLISLGVAGFGAIAGLSSGLNRLILVAGSAFLTAYGITRLIAAWRGVYAFQDGADTRSLGATLALAAMFTWANPHVYLDTVFLLGAVSTGFSGAEKWTFAFGAIAASFMFFFSLGYGARQLSPVMRSVAAWRILDLSIGVLMLWLALIMILTL